MGHELCAVNLVLSTHHHLLGLLRLLVALAEIDNRVEVDGVGVLKDDLELSSFIGRLFAVLSKGDDNLALSKSAYLAEDHRAHGSTLLPSSLIMCGVYMFLL